MIFSKSDGKSPFVYQTEGCKSFFLETKSDYLVGGIPYDYKVYLSTGDILMLAPTVIDRWLE